MRAHNPSSLWNNQQKLSCCRLRNHHRNSFQRWRVDSEELPALIDSEKVNENGVGAAWKSSPRNLKKVTRCFGSARSPCRLRKSQQKWSRCCLGNHHRNTFQSWRVDSEALEAPVDLKKTMKTESIPAGKSSPKHLPKVTHGFGSTRSPFDLKKTMKTESIPDGKSSPKHLPKVTRGFGSTSSPCWRRKSQQKRRRFRLWNRQRNTFYKWCLDSWEHTAPLNSEIINKN